MANFDYDVLIIGSGFGGSVAALRAAEKGYRVGVMESGRRWNDEDIPKTHWDLPDFLWFPGAESVSRACTSWTEASCRPTRE
jgi:cholesterol oxidase